MRKKKLYSGNGIVYSTNPDFTSQQKTDDSITLSPADQLLRIDARHRGGKTVTIVEGFSGAESDLEQLGKQLKAYCGTGGTVKDNEIIIQGDNRDKVLSWLNKMGFRKAKKQ